VHTVSFNLRLVEHLRDLRSLKLALKRVIVGHIYADDSYLCPAKLFLKLFSVLINALEVCAYLSYVQKVAMDIQCYCR